VAILQLRLDVDSDVHPELHAVLSAIGRAASRAERLRQLASNGLIWEHLRVRAHPPAQVDASGGIDAIVDAPRAEPVAQTSQAPAPAPAPVAVAVAVEGAGSNAKPTRQRSLPSRNIPILSDAVDLGAVADRKRIATGQRAAISASEKRAVQVVPNRVDAALPGAAVEPAPPPGRTAGPRPRMMRMKEKGLFNNG
jgi:hypothetical protein